MIVFTHIFATIVPLLSGFCLLSVMPRLGMSSRTLWEQIGLSYFVGIILVALEIFTFSYFGKVGFLLLLTLQLVPIALFVLRFLVWKKRPFFQSHVSLRPLVRNSWWQWILIILIISKLVYIFSMNLTELRRTDDAFKYALAVAKHTYFEGSHTEFEMLRNYPKLPGLILSWFGIVRGQWDEFALNLPYFNYYAFFLLLFYANLRKRTGKGPALMGTYVLSGFPILLSHAVLIGYADFPMAIYLCFTGVYAYYYACRGKIEDIILAGFFALCLPLIKTEGKIPFFFFGLYTIAAALAYRYWHVKPATIWGVTGGLVLFVGLVLAAMVIYYGKTDPPFLPARLWYRIMPGNHWGEIMGPLLAHFGSYFNNWLVLGTLCPVALVPLTILFAKRDEFIIGIFSLLLLTSYLYLFCVGGAYEFLIDGTTVNRSYLQILPTMLFASVVMVASLWQRGAVNRAVQGKK